MNKGAYSSVENSSIAIVVLVFGIMAGFFWTYSFNINYAMMNVEGEIYAQVQSLFNHNVRHFMFFIFFFGGGLFSVLACLLNLKHRKQISYWLLVLASMIYIFGVIVYTAQVNLPLNYYTESWNPSDLPADWMVTRDAWNQANMIRVFTSFTSFLLSILTLLLRSFGVSQYY